MASVLTGPEVVPGHVRRGRPRDTAVDEVAVAATAELLGEVGFAGLTMAEVAARAGVGKASLYLRWPSKVELVADAIRRRSGVVPPVPDTGCLAEDMRAFLYLLLRAKRADRSALYGAVAELANHPELAEVWRSRLATTLLSPFQTVIERGLGGESCLKTLMCNCCRSCRWPCCSTGASPTQSSLMKT